MLKLLTKQNLVMKKLTYLFALSGLFLFAACGGGASQEAAPEEVAPEEAVVEEAVVEEGSSEEAATDDSTNVED